MKPTGNLRKHAAASIHLGVACYNIHHSINSGKELFLFTPFSPSKYNCNLYITSIIHTIAQKLKFQGHISNAELHQPLLDS